MWLNEPRAFCAMSIDEYAAPVITSLIMDGGSLFVSLGDLPCDDDDQIVPDLLTPAQISSSILASHHHYGQGGGGPAASNSSQLNSPDLSGFPSQVHFTS
ncbi:unnamed protein product [Allacma fusca]|uniref:Uncharacterized protein n=1 Tax=Allacma fusca TaxID=39272 RepID=A0A8J2PIM4_9HEXA|nr:unnamed protein product [Allacma fusca]